MTTANVQNNEVSVYPVFFYSEGSLVGYAMMNDGSIEPAANYRAEFIAWMETDAAKNASKPELLEALKLEMVKESPEFANVPAEELVDAAKRREGVLRAEVNSSLQHAMDTFGGDFDNMAEMMRAEKADYSNPSTIASIDKALLDISVAKASVFESLKKMAKEEIARIDEPKSAPKPAPQPVPEAPAHVALTPEVMASLTQLTKIATESALSDINSAIELLATKVAQITVEEPKSAPKKPAPRSKPSAPKNPQGSGTGKGKAGKKDEEKESEK